MVLTFRKIFFIALGILILWFLYIERAILTPFVLAAIFAYIFNPVVNFFSNKMRLPRTISVIIIYLAIIFLFSIFAVWLSNKIIDESTEFNNFTFNLLRTAEKEANSLPDWVRPSVNEAFSSLEKSRIFSTQRLFALFPQAISRIVSFFIFLFSGFYFLKEGRNIFDKFFLFIPGDQRIEVEILVKKINKVLGGYLRGQLLMVFIISIILYICLSVLNVRFALMIAVFSGFAEIVPIIGPITAGGVASIVALITNSSSFSFNPIQNGIAVIIVYFVVRMFQDYFITPHVMGKITKLHPLIILFAVLAGGHIAGLLGLILAVPVAAAIKILLEFSLDKIALQEENKPDSV